MKKLSLLFFVVLLIQNLGANTFDQGMKEYQKGNYKKSVEYFKISCDDNQYGACINLGFAYANGKGIKKDPKQAIKYFKEACSETKNIYGGCSNLAVMYEKVLNNNKKAIQYAHLSCEKGDVSGCLESGYIHNKLNDKKNAIKYYEQSCNLGNGNACKNAGVLYNEANNKTKSAKLFNTGCILNDADSCFNLSLLIQKDEPKKAYNLLKQACQYGNSQVCEIINNSKQYKVINGYQLSINDIRYVYDERDKRCYDTTLAMNKSLSNILDSLKDKSFQKYYAGGVVAMMPNNVLFFASKSECLLYSNYNK